MTLKFKASLPEPRFNSIDWHKANAARSEAWSAAMCQKLGITASDLRQIAQKKKAH